MQISNVTKQTPLVVSSSVTITIVMKSVTHFTVVQIYAQISLQIIARKKSYIVFKIIYRWRKRNVSRNQVSIRLPKVTMDEDVVIRQLYIGQTAVLSLTISNTCLFHLLIILKSKHQKPVCKTAIAIISSI